MHENRPATPASFPTDERPPDTPNPHDRSIHEVTGAISEQFKNLQPVVEGRMWVCENELDGNWYTLIKLEGTDSHPQIKHLASLPPHPNLIRYHGSWYEEDSTFLLTERIGDPVFSYSLSSEEAIALIRQVSSVNIPHFISFLPMTCFFFGFLFIS
eukprot:c486_g1_i1.p1 GENE.c486_g1_i1~~c486_g1_i1.p1  ORF type:complete len:168 (-),score=30.94 c486_g1_i1:456-923(-)